MSIDHATTRLSRRSAIVGVASAALICGLTDPARATDGTGSWRLVSSMPHGRRCEFPAATVNGKIYAFGGSARGVGYAIVHNEEYDPATGHWADRAPMPQGRNHIGAVVLDNKIYAVGGFSGNAHKDPHSDVFVYDPASDAWDTIAPLPTKRGAVAVAALNGKIHAIGGREGDKPLIARHDVYDFASNSWHKAAPLSRPRDHMVAMAVNGKIHVIGGRWSVGDEDMTGIHQIYDPKTDGWTSGPPMPTPRGGVSGALYRGMIFVMGAEDGKRTYDENEAFDVKTNRWHKFHRLPLHLHAFGAAVAENSLYIFGGGKQSGSFDVISSVYAFTLA